MTILRGGGDFIFCQVNAVDDLPNDPQVQANQYVVDFDHPRFGATQVMGIPVRLRQTPGSVRPTPGTGAPISTRLAEDVAVQKVTSPATSEDPYELITRVFFSSNKSITARVSGSPLRNQLETRCADSSRNCASAAARLGTAVS